MWAARFAAQPCVVLCVTDFGHLRRFLYLEFWSVIHGDKMFGKYSLSFCKTTTDTGPPGSLGFVLTLCIINDLHV